MHRLVRNLSSRLPRLVWIAIHVGLSIAFLAGYYVLLFLVGGGLVLMAYHSFRPKTIPDLFLYLFGQLTGWPILISVPLPRPYRAPGARLDAKEHPLLFETLNKVASLTGNDMPAEIYATDSAWAYMLKRGGVLGFGGKTVLEIGLPLLHVLTVSEFEAMVAREFGHMHRRDRITNLCVNKVREGLELREHMMKITLVSLFPRIQYFVDLPFTWYRKTVACVFDPILREQELLADRYAAAAIGRRPLADALSILEQTQFTFLNYRDDEVWPAVFLGYEIPLIEGFAAYLESNANLSVPDTDRRAPPLAERLSAIADLPAGRIDDDSSALSLVNALERLEREALAANARPGEKRLKPIPWIEAGERVVVRMWSLMCLTEPAPFRDLSLDSLPSAVRTAKSDFQKSILAAALGHRLYREGWDIDHKPGFTRMTRDGTTIEPAQLIKELASPEFTQDQWRDILTGWKLDPAFPLDPWQDPPGNVARTS